MQNQSEALPRLSADGHQQHGRALPHHQRMACAASDLSAIGCLKATCAADRIERFRPGMNVHGRSHAGRKGRLQILSAEIAPSGLKRKWADIGQVMATLESAPLGTKVKQPNLAESFDHDAKGRLGAFGRLDVGERIDAPEERPWWQRSKDLMGNKASWTRRLTRLSRTGSRCRLGVRRRRRQDEQRERAEKPSYRV